MNPKRFGYLPSDPMRWIQRHERVLKDHRDILAANPSHLGCRQSQ